MANLKDAIVNGSCRIIGDLYCSSQISGAIGTNADKLIVTTSGGQLTSGSTLAASSLPSGAAPTVALSNGTITFGIPKGDTGATGATGAQGPKGDTGATGAQGVSVSKVEQTTTSTADAGTNVITVTLSNGTTTTFNVKNGSKGSTGATGSTGAAAGFGTPTASVDANVGTPSVTVTASGADTAKVFNFAFKNLKGQKGDAGTTPTINAASGTNIGTVGTPSVTASTSGTTTTFTFDYLKGAKGDKGDDGAPGPQGPKGDTGATGPNFTLEVGSGDQFLIGASSQTGNIKTAKTSGAYFNGSGITASGFYVSSLRSLKENIEPTKVNATELINSQEIVDFNYKADVDKAPKVGLIADDSDPLFLDKKGETVDLYNTCGILMKAVQELSKRVEELEQKLN